MPYLVPLYNQASGRVKKMQFNRISSSSTEEQSYRVVISLAACYLPDAKALQDKALAANKVQSATVLWNLRKGSDH